MNEKIGYIIETKTLEAGSHQFDFQLNNDYFQAIEKTEILGGDVAVKAQLELRESDFDLHILASGSVDLTCDRCLDPVTYDFEVEDDYTSQQIIEDETEAVDHQKLDLAWLAYELIVINLPLVHRHPEGDCNPEMAALLQNHLCSTDEDPEIL